MKEIERRLKGQAKENKVIDNFTVHSNDHVCHKMIDLHIVKQGLVVFEA